jgi:DNA replication and repair protein RecF
VSKEAVLTPLHQATVGEGRPQAALPVLAVRRLVLSDFRCYPRLVVEAAARPQVLTGPNGAGKTNLLEALSFLSPGRGLRQARLGEVTRRGAEGGWAVAASLERGAGQVEIGTGLAPGTGGATGGAAERRVVKLDGETARGAAALSAHVNVLWLTPQMDRLFVDGPRGRRRFLDRLVFGFDADHARRVAAYEHAMRERTRLLREAGADADWIGALEGSMAEHGVAVAAARRAAVAWLKQGLASGLGPFPGAEVDVAGALEGWLDEMPALEAEERFSQRLAEARARDGAAGSAGEGPHRSDLEVRHAASGMPAAQCSTGEQKALLIAIVLANARLQAAQRGCAPLLLLDEVAAHLDRARRQALFEEIRATRAQAWLTGTDRALFEGLEGWAEYTAVGDGRLTAMANN